jgi:hypothetical protein
MVIQTLIDCQTNIQCLSLVSQINVINVCNISFALIKMSFHLYNDQNIFPITAVVLTFTKMPSEKKRDTRDSFHNIKHKCLKQLCNLVCSNTFQDSYINITLIMGVSNDYCLLLSCNKLIKMIFNLARKVSSILAS